MSDQNVPYPWPQGHAAPEPAPVAGPQTRFIDQALSEPPTDDEPVRGQRGLGPFTLREWLVIGVGIALVVLSFFSLFSGAIGRGYAPVWSFGVAWVGAVGLPLAAVVLVVLRRMLPRFRNVGGLSIDQAASVAFSVAAFVWLDIGIILTQMSAGIGELVSQFASGLPLDAGDVFGVSAIVWVAFVVALAGVFFTVFARFVPPFSEDFAGREEVPAHPTARPVRPLVQAPRPQPASWPAAAPGSTGAPYAQQPQPGAGDPHAWPPVPDAYGAPASQAQATPDQQAPQARDPFATPEAGPGEWPADGTRAEPASQAASPGAPEAVVEPAAAPADDAATAGPQDADAAAPQSERAAPSAAPDAQAAGDASNGIDEVAPVTTPVASVDPAAAPEETAVPEETIAPDAQPDESSPVVDDTVVRAGDAGQTVPAPQASAAPQAQPFWALVPVERDVHDFEGRPIFRIGPTAWALVLEDRGTYFVVRHDDGRIGYLHDTTGVTRG